VEHRIERVRTVMQAVGARRERDRVTGLFNRRHFFERVARLLEQPDAHARPAAVIHIQADGLGQLRQDFGIGAVDTLTADIGERVRKRVTAQDVAARFDESTVALFVRRETPHAIAELAEQLRAAIAAQPFALSGKVIGVTASVGYCLLGDDKTDAAGLVARAERASSQAAREGGDRVVCYSPPPQVPKEASGGPNIGEFVREALQQNQLVIHYQPLLDLEARGSETYEMLLRVPDASGDLYVEQEYREAAEQADLVDALDEWLIDRAIDMLKARRESSRPTRLFLRQLGGSAFNPDFPVWLAARLRARQSVGTGLVLDYRLADVSRNLKAAQRTFRALHEMDVEISLSRFPEKPAAFKVLRFLEANYIQITPRLLKADRETIRFVVDQTHEAKARVIVGNIDDARSVDLHWSAGADYLQGNFIQRPLEHMDYDFYQVVV